MKQLTIIAALILTSCGPSREEMLRNPDAYITKDGKFKNPDKLEPESTPSGINTHTIDGCEYITYHRFGPGVSIIHKANCKNHKP